MRVQACSLARLCKHRPRNWLCQAAGGAAPSGGSAVREATSVGVL